jgi:hypothetical protein
LKKAGGAFLLELSQAFDVSVAMSCFQEIQFCTGLKFVAFPTARNGFFLAALSYTAERITTTTPATIFAS